MPNTPKRHLRDPEATTAHGRPLPICRSNGRDLTDDPAAVTCGTCHLVIAAMAERAVSGAVVVLRTLPDRHTRTGAWPIGRKPPAVHRPEKVHLRDVSASDPWRQALCRQRAGAFATLPSEVTCGTCQRILAASIGGVRAKPTAFAAAPRQHMPRTRPESHEKRRDRVRRMGDIAAAPAPPESQRSASPAIRTWVRRRDAPAGPVCVDGTQAHRRRVAWEDGVERGVCRLCGDVKIYHQEVEANVWH